MLIKNLNFLIHRIHFMNYFKSVTKSKTNYHLIAYQTL